MKYYEDRQKAINTIELACLRPDGCQIADLKRTISKEFGFSHLIVDKTIKTLVDLQLVYIKDGCAFPQDNVIHDEPNKDT